MENIAPLFYKGVLTMIREDLNNFEDGQAINEDDIATVVGYCDSTVIYEDDSGSIFFLIAELPELFEIGTIAKIDTLAPITEAGDELTKHILAVMKGGNK